MAWDLCDTETKLFETLVEYATGWLADNKYKAILPAKTSIKFIKQGDKRPATGVVVLLKVTRQPSSGWPYPVTETVEGEPVTKQVLEETHHVLMVVSSDQRGSGASAVSKVANALKVLFSARGGTDESTALIGEGVYNMSEGTEGLVVETMGEGIPEEGVAFSQRVDLVCTTDVYM